MKITNEHIEELKLPHSLLNKVKEKLNSYIGKENNKELRNKITKELMQIVNDSIEIEERIEVESNEDGTFRAQLQVWYKWK